MAERKPSKARPPPPKGGLKRTAPPAPAITKAAPASPKTATANLLQTAVEKLEARFKELKRERDALEAELDEARARIMAMETARTDAINRIDWVLDSLHNVLQDEQ